MTWDSKTAINHTFWILTDVFGNKVMVNANEIQTIGTEERGRYRDRVTRIQLSGTVILVKETIEEIIKLFL